MPSHLRKLGIATTALFLISVVPRSARADDTRNIVWDDDNWTRVKPWEYVLTYTLVAGTGAVVFLFKSPHDPRWSGPILFDEQTRDLFRLHDDTWRSSAGIASDLLYYGNTAFPILVDSLAVTLGIRGSSDAAWQELSIDLEGLAISGILNQSAQRFVARERPYVGPCRVAPNGKDCNPAPSEENVSFFSGHVTMAFTGAMLTCVNHANLHLYGSKFLDGLSCAAMLGTATATSFLRLMSDRHYASDVLLGAGIGAAVGYLVPALHYRVFSHHANNDALLVPLIDRDTVGASLSVRF